LALIPFIALIPPPLFFKAKIKMFCWVDLIFIVIYFQDEFESCFKVLTSVKKQLLHDKILGKKCDLCRWVC